MSEKGIPRPEARVRRQGARVDAEPPASPDLGALLSGDDPAPPPPPRTELRKGAAVSGPVIRLASDAVFIDIGEGRTGLLPLESYRDEGGRIPLSVGQELFGTVRVSPGESLSVLLSPARGPASSGAEDGASTAEETAVDSGAAVEAAPAAEVSAAAPPTASAAQEPAPPPPAPRPGPIAGAPPRARVAPAPVQEDDEPEDFASLLADHLDGTVRISEGSEVTGTVVKVTDEVIFVNLEAKTEGLLDAAEYKDVDGNLTLKVGDTVTAYVVSTGMDEGGIRLSRSMGAGPNPMEAIEEAASMGIPVEGRLVSRNKGGFEVRIGTVRGFLPLSQLDIHRVEEEALDEFIGQTLRFKILRIKGKEVVLSRAELIKEEAAQTIETLKRDLKEGAVVTGRVRSLKEYGAFIELAPGLDGLLHVSELSWGRVSHPRELLEVGQEITVQVLKYDRDTDRLSLGLKQLGRDPWLTITEDFREEQVVVGRVERLTQFGAFITIADGVDGLLHVSNMSWERRINKPSEVVKVGDQVQVQILGIDPANRRISLGLKQLMGDPWAGVEEKYAPGSKVEGTVEKVESFGVFVLLEPGITALIPMSEAGMGPGSDVRRELSPGTRVTAAVLEVDAERRRISLSRKALDGAEERQQFQSYKQARGSEKAQTDSGFGTLAAAFGKLKVKK